MTGASFPRPLRTSARALHDIGVIAMLQRGQVLELEGGRGGRGCWASRYRSAAATHGGCKAGVATAQAAAEALERALEQLRRERGLAEAPTLAELVDLFLAPHDGEPETTEKLRWMLAKSVHVFGDRRVSRLLSAEIAA